MSNPKETKSTPRKWEQLAGTARDTILDYARNGDSASSGHLIGILDQLLLEEWVETIPHPADEGLLDEKHHDVFEDLDAIEHAQIVAMIERRIAGYEPSMRLARRQKEERAKNPLITLTVLFAGGPAEVQGRLKTQTESDVEHRVNGKLAESWPANAGVDVSLATPTSAEFLAECLKPYGFREYATSNDANRQAVALAEMGRPIERESDDDFRTRVNEARRHTHLATIPDRVTGEELEHYAYQTGHGRRGAK